MYPFSDLLAQHKLISQRGKSKRRETILKSRFYGWSQSISVFISVVKDFGNKQRYNNVRFNFGEQLYLKRVRGQITLAAH